VLYLQALEQIEEADLPYYLAVIRQKLTDSYRYQLRLDEAREQNQLGTALCREKNFVSSLVEALRTAVLIALASDRTQDALPPLREAIQHAAGLGDAQQLDCVAAGAAWAISQQNYTAAAEWLGRAREGSKHPHHTREFARWEKTITQALGPAQTRAALQRGQAMRTPAAFAAVRAAVE
ncbi:MAG: hypothetical protein ACFB51_14610, partial [Anaerolineae bacterium]